MDIVPSLIARQPFGPSVAPCGWRVLCGRDIALDLGRVQVGREGVDIVGTYHAWCSLRGWRSCARDNHLDSSWLLQMSNLVCDVISALHFTSSECHERGINRIVAAREAALIAERNAPFWHEGGDLLVHILIPHLPVGKEPQTSIEAAYEKNLERAASYIGEMADRLLTRYPHGFRLVIFSDHPLRPITRCDRKLYQTCGRPARYADPYQVPVIVSAPDYVPLPEMATNLYVFDLDLRRQSHR